MFITFFNKNSNKEKFYFKMSEIKKKYFNNFVRKQTFTDENSEQMIKRIQKIQKES